MNLKLCQNRIEKDWETIEKQTLVVGANLVGIEKTLRFCYFYFKKNEQNENKSKNKNTSVGILDFFGWSVVTEMCMLITHLVTMCYPPKKKKSVGVRARRRHHMMHHDMRTPTQNGRSVLTKNAKCRYEMNKLNNNLRSPTQNHTSKKKKD